MSDDKANTMDDNSPQGSLDLEPNESLEQIDRAKLELTLDHCKKLFEEEKLRLEALNRMTTVYLGAISLVVGGVILRVAAVNGMPSLTQIIREEYTYGSALSFLVVALIYLCTALFFLAFVFTILVVRIRQGERLSDSRLFASRAISRPNDMHLVAAMIADYVVATEYKYLINEKKAALLKRALNCLLGALAVAMITIMTITFIG